MLQPLKFSFPILLILGSFAPFAQAQSIAKSALSVEIDGLKNQTGLLCIRLFSNSKDFPGGNGASAQRECVKITEEPVKFTFKNLTPGSYAVAVFHDENGDRTLNRNGAGMPLEGYGFSNNPIIRQKAPNFGQAIFLVAGPNTGVKIQMKYGAGN
jgi:uncharacterized protein (DUF2141 family)